MLTKIIPLNVSLQQATPCEPTSHQGQPICPGGIGFTPEAPQFLPVKFNDDNIVPVPVLVTESEANTEEKHGFMGKMKGLCARKRRKRGN